MEVVEDTKVVIKEVIQEDLSMVEILKEDMVAVLRVDLMVLKEALAVLKEDSEEVLKEASEEVLRAVLLALKEDSEEVLQEDTISLQWEVTRVGMEVMEILNQVQIWAMETKVLKTIKEVLHLDPGATKAGLLDQVAIRVVLRLGRVVTKVVPQWEEATLE